MSHTEEKLLNWEKKKKLFSIGTTRTREKKDPDKIDKEIELLTTPRKQ